MLLGVVFVRALNLPAEQNCLIPLLVLVSYCYLEENLVSPVTLIIALDSEAAVKMLSFNFRLKKQIMKAVVAPLRRR